MKMNKENINVFVTLHSKQKPFMKKKYYNEN